MAGYQTNPKLTHDELVKKVALELAVAFDATRKDYVTSDLVLDVARKFERYLKEASK